MRVINKKANFEYLLTGEHFEAGIVLLGAEAKSLRNSRADLKQSVVRAIDNELYLINCNIPVVSPPRGYTPTRSRKLLLNKKEIVSAITKSKQLKLTFVPVSMYNKGRLIKISVALGKPKKKYDKRASIKEKDVKREIDRALKNS